MEIKELKDKQSDITITGTLTDKSPIREFSKMGDPGRVCIGTIEDESGKIALVLWNDEIDAAETGDKIKITGGYVKTYNGELQLTTGRSGKISKL